MGVGAVRQDTHKRAPSQRRRRRPRSTSPRPTLPTPVRPGIVRRNTLVERLRNADGLRGGDHGYGKTTLLAEWAERDRRPFAVSVDEADGDPVVFLGHVAVALDRIEPIERDVLESIASPTGANSARVLSRLSSSPRGRSRSCSSWTTSTA